MSAKGKHLRRRWLVSGATAVTVAVAVVGAIRHDDFQSDAQSSGRQASSSHRSGASAAPSGALGAGTGPCGPASAATIASVDTKVARRIYAGELRGEQVSADIAHIKADSQLLSALASSDEATVGARVRTIVYTPHWHIVRLRVAKNGRVLADVGGPEIIAPVSGALRWQGRKVGSFVMSVQDDIGYVKLVSRFIGVPVDLYREGSFLTGTLEPAPLLASAGQSVTVAGRAYEAHVLDELAFPSGTLQAALFVPKPSSAEVRRSCAALKIAAWGGIAKHVAARFSPLSAHYSDLAGALKGATAGLVYVRAGAKQLAGGTRPARIPHGGTVSYRGRSWSVFSWEPVPPARVYLLVPAG